MDLMGKRVRHRMWPKERYIDVEWNREDTFAGISNDGFGEAVIILEVNLEILSKPAPKKLPSDRIKEIYDCYPDLMDINAARWNAIQQYLDEDFKERNKQ